MIIPGIGDGSKLRRDIKALLDVSKESGDMQYLATTEVQARLAGPTATNQLLGWDGTKPAWAAIVTATAGYSPSFASKADMEAATATTLIVTPEVFQNHAGTCKAWAYFSTTSATGLIAGYNVSSVERTASGRYGIRFSVNFTSSDYAFSCNAEQDFAGTLVWAGRNATATGGQLASSFDMIVINSGGAPADPTHMTAFFYGDQ